MAVKLLRTIRLDASDTFVFERAAEPGEWAVPGGFMFWGADPRALAGRERQAFRAGFLGLDTFGWSTLAVVVEATEAEHEAAIAGLAATWFIYNLAYKNNISNTVGGSEASYSSLKESILKQ